MCASDGRISLQTHYRSHTCGQLRKVDVDCDVTLIGFVHRVRDLGGLVFIDLRDHYGKTQLVMSREKADEIGNIKAESVLQIKGKVAARKDVNPDMPTGEIEINVETGELMSRPESLPFVVTDEKKIPEHDRLRYRFLDLRRERLHENIVLRCKVIKKIREVMHDMDFLEIETPILTGTSPEGARDYVVPSRVHPGKFYALPQAPQQFKQLLMAGGFDRYFQIAPCFRDEDARADRSPGEFKQLDMEMAYVSQDDVFAAAEQAMYEVFKAFTEFPVSEPPFLRLKYDEAMAWYGSDKPDLRIAAKITDVAHIFEKTDFGVFKKVLEDGGSLRALKFDVKEAPSRKYFDGLIKFFQEQGGGGLAWMAWDGKERKGSIKKFVGDDEWQMFVDTMGVDGPCLIVIAGGDDKVILPAMGKLRLKLAEEHDAIEQGCYRFCWIVDFPMYEEDPETGKIEFGHNPFSMPQGGLQALQEQEPLSIKAWQYDIVCNGTELSSGAIRNHDPETMYKAFEIAGYDKSVVDEKFGGMIRAFKCGAPPHGGIAPGVDRIVMLLANEPNIREVTPFPMSPDARDLMMGAPSELSQEQLDELHLILDVDEKGGKKKAKKRPSKKDHWSKADGQPQDLVLVSQASDFVGQDVSMLGWVAGVRTSKNRAFIEFRDGSGFLQALAEYAELDEDTVALVNDLQLESSIRIHGSVHRHPRHENEVEVHLKSISVEQRAEEFPITRKPHGPEFLLNNRHLWLRTKRQVAIQKIRDTIARATVDYFASEGFIKIDSPIITANACEGTTTLFPVDYFGEEAFLSQSGQLYLEAAIAAHGRVYDFGPVFRAERSKTRKHLTEFWMMDAEMAYVEHEGNLKLQEELILFIIERVLSERQRELADLERDVAALEAIKGPFPRVTHAEIVEILQKKGSEITKDTDLGAPDETLLADIYDQPLFITEWPAHIKAFYMKRHPEKPGVVLAADLMAPEAYGELIGGSQREENYDALVERMKEEKIPLDEFSWFLELRKYGSVPHSGFGFGLERLVSWLSGVKHIRETIPFPRMLNRMRP